MYKPKTIITAVVCHYLSVHSLHQSLATYKQSPQSPQTTQNTEHFSPLKMVHSLQTNTIHANLHDMQYNTIMYVSQNYVS